jgi:hypothetical protein
MFSRKTVTIIVCMSSGGVTRGRTNATTPHSLFSMSALLYPTVNFASLGERELDALIARVITAVEEWDDGTIMLMKSLVTPTDRIGRDFWRNLASIAARDGNVIALDYIHRWRGYYSDELQCWVSGTGIDPYNIVREAMLSKDPEMMAYARKEWPMEAGLPIY